MTQKRNDSPSQRKFKLDLKTFNKVLYALILVCGAYYVISVNDLSIQGFVLQDAKERIRDLSNKNDDNELRAMSLQSYQHITDRIAKLKLVKTDQIQYVTSASEVVAKR